VRGYGGVIAYAAILSAIGAGTVLGGLLSGYLRSQRGAMLWLIPAAAGPLALAVGLPLPLVLVAFVAVGAVQPVHDVLLSATLRNAVPHAALGPVSAVEEVGSLAVLPAGQVLGGLTLDQFGLTPTASVIVAALCAVPLLSAVPLPRPRTRPDTTDIRNGSPATATSR
jgi:hypothetical protein